jgi:hypothetical protein
LEETSLSPIGIIAEVETSCSGFDREGKRLYVFDF